MCFAGSPDATPASPNSLPHTPWPCKSLRKCRVESSGRAGPREGVRKTVVGEDALLTCLANVLTWLLRLARYVYLLRVPIIVAAIFFVFPFAALRQHSPLRALFQNLFLMDGGNVMWPWPTFWSTMAALILAWSIL